MLLVAHGSRDPRAARTVEGIAEQVRRVLPGRSVAVAYLDFSSPSVREALRELATDGVRDVVAVPLLFTPGYHVRVDLPAAIAEVRAGQPELDVVIAPPLGASPEAGEPQLLDALEARLPSAASYDAVVLASAGSADPEARAAVEEIADAWGRRLGRPVVPAYATACGPTVSEAIEQLRLGGSDRVAVAGLFIAPGRLPSAVQRDGAAAGAAFVAEPLGLDPNLVALIGQRAGTARRALAAAAR